MSITLNVGNDEGGVTALDLFNAVFNPVYRTAENSNVFFNLSKSSDGDSYGYVRYRWEDEVIKLITDDDLTPAEVSNLLDTTPPANYEYELDVEPFHLATYYRIMLVVIRMISMSNAANKRFNQIIVSFDDLVFTTECKYEQ